MISLTKLADRLSGEFATRKIMPCPICAKNTNRHCKYACRDGVYEWLVIQNRDVKKEVEK